MRGHAGIVQLSNIKISRLLLKCNFFDLFSLSCPCKPVQSNVLEFVVDFF